MVLAKFSIITNATLTTETSDDIMLEFFKSHCGNFSFQVFIYLFDALLTAGLPHNQDIKPSFKGI